MRQNFNTLLQTIQQYKLFPPGATILIAVSGGADSLALLHWLAHHRQPLQIALHVATLNHGIRDISVDETRFVQSMAQAWNVSCTVGHADVPQVATQQKMGIEAAARQVRYQFLAETARQVNAVRVVTAHHADDQSETILMHILRGAGVQGLQGMSLIAPVPDHPDLTLVRPLLNISRAEIEAYCDRHSLHPIVDDTNFDTDYRRNQLRLDILPRLREINPQLDAALARLADIVATEDDYLSQLYHQQYRPQVTFSKRVTVSLSALQSWHPAIQRRFLIDALRHLTTEPHFEHIRHALTIVQTGNVGSIAEFSGNIHLRIGYEMVYIEPANLPRSSGDYVQMSGEIPLLLPGETIVGDYKIVASTEALTDYHAKIDVPDDAKLILRTRQPGDKFAPSGMNGRHQKIKDWLIDNKIPAFVRDGLPIVIKGNTIVAIVLLDSWRIAESFAINETSQRIFYFKVCKM